MIFIENKYTRVYFAIITKAKETIHPATTYTEKHHIIPKSLGGSNTKDNLVKLTAREHFVCHRLLTKMTCGTALYKMQKAVERMTASNKFHNRLYISAKLFEQLRIQSYNAHSLLMTGRFSKEDNPMYGKKHTEETKQKLRNAAKLREKSSIETRNKISIARAKQVYSILSKSKMSAAWKLKTKLTCIHCGIICPPHLHNRWHGNNCKLNSGII